MPQACLATPDDLPGTGGLVCKQSGDRATMRPVQNLVQRIGFEACIGLAHFVCLTGVGRDARGSRATGFPSFAGASPALRQRAATFTVGGTTEHSILFLWSAAQAPCASCGVKL